MKTKFNPIQFINRLSRHDKERVLSPLAIRLARWGNRHAAEYLANHPKSVVFLNWIRAHRLTGEPCDNNETFQCVQMDFGIGIPQSKEHDESDHIWFRIDIDANDELQFGWRDWRIEDGGEKPKFILPIILGDWIKRSKTLKPQELEEETYLFGDTDVQMTIPLARFRKEFREWSAWAVE